MLIMTPKTRISIDVNYDESPVLFKNTTYKFTETLKGYCDFKVRQTLQILSSYRPRGKSWNQLFYNLLSL